MYLCWKRFFQCFVAFWGFCYTLRVSFPSRISSLNVTKSPVSCGFGHIYSLMKSFIFCAVFILVIIADIVKIIISYVFNVPNKFTIWFVHVSSLWGRFSLKIRLIFKKCFLNIKRLRACLGCSYCILGRRGFLCSFNQTVPCLGSYFPFEFLSYIW